MSRFEAKAFEPRTRLIFMTRTSDAGFNEISFSNHSLRGPLVRDGLVLDFLPFLAGIIFF